MNKFRQEDGVVFETSAVVLSVDGDNVRISFDGLELETHFQSLVMLKQSVHVNDRVIYNDEHARVRERLENDVYLLHIIGQTGSDAYRIAKRDDIRHFNKDDRLFANESLIPAAAIPSIPMERMAHEEFEEDTGPAAESAPVDETEDVPAVEEPLELVQEAPAIEEAPAAEVEEGGEVEAPAALQDTVTETAGEVAEAVSEAPIAEAIPETPVADAAEKPVAPAIQRPDVAAMATSFGSLVDKGRNRTRRPDLESLGVTDTVLPVKTGDMVLDDDLTLQPETGKS